MWMKVFALAGLAMNGGIALSLRKDAQAGTTHRDAWRHAGADTLSAAVTAGSLAATATGHPTVDAITGIGMGVWTIACTLPTKSRLESADEAFAPLAEASELSETVVPEAGTQDPPVSS
jgi:Co/Zn/Cd efflux system component